MEISKRLVSAPIVDEVYEWTGYETLFEDEYAFLLGYEIGRDDAQDNDPCKICGALPAQRAGYIFGYVGEYDAKRAYSKWIRMGRVA
jgi:hypothetical protein